MFFSFYQSSIRWKHMIEMTFNIDHVITNIISNKLFFIKIIQRLFLSFTDNKTYGNIRFLNCWFRRLWCRLIWCFWITSRAFLLNLKKLLITIETMDLNRECIYFWRISSSWYFGFRCFCVFSWTFAWFAIFFRVWWFRFRRFGFFIAIFSCAYWITSIFILFKFPCF